MSGERTKGKWEVNCAYSTIVMSKDKDGRYHDVCECENEADAVRIAKHHNNHDRLVKALKEIAIPKNGWCEGPCEMCGPEKKRSDIARAALARMEKEDLK